MIGFLACQYGECSKKLLAEKSFALSVEKKLAKVICPDKWKVRISSRILVNMTSPTLQGLGCGRFLETNRSNVYSIFGGNQIVCWCSSYSAGWCKEYNRGWGKETKREQTSWKRKEQQVTIYVPKQSYNIGVWLLYMTSEGRANVTIEAKFLDQMWLNKVFPLTVLLLRADFLLIQSRSAKSASKTFINKGACIARPVLTARDFVHSVVSFC